MATPAWVRRHHQRERATIAAGRAELHIQALERIDEDEAKAVEQWTPRRGMSFASDPTPADTAALIERSIGAAKRSWRPGDPI